MTATRVLVLIGLLSAPAVHAASTTWQLTGEGGGVIGTLDSALQPAGGAYAVVDYEIFNFDESQTYCSYYRGVLRPRNR